MRPGLGKRARGYGGAREEGRGVAWTFRRPAVCRSERTVCPGAEPQVDAGPVRGNALPQEAPAPGPDFWQCPGSSLERGQADPWAPPRCQDGSAAGCRACRFLSSLCAGSHRGARSVSFPVISKDEGHEVMKSPDEVPWEGHEVETAEKSHAGPSQLGAVCGRGCRGWSPPPVCARGTGWQALRFPVGRAYICRGRGRAWGWQPAEVD